MDVEIITVGDELLIGQIVDTNSSWMGRELNRHGFRVVHKTVVGDEEKSILDAIEAASKRVGVVLMTGGLGPTKDDITLQALCKRFGCTLHFSDEVYANIVQLFSRSGRAINELTRLQSMTPDKATIIQNRVGTAPCTWFEESGLILISMPGVPSEMEWLMSNEVLPRLCRRFPTDMVINHHSYRITGFTESQLAIYIADFEDSLPSCIKLAYLPQGGSIVLRLSEYVETAEKKNNDEKQTETSTLKEACRQLEALLQKHIVAIGDSPLENVAGERLRAAGKTVATAESCTGGAIAVALTSVPGSSDYFLGSIVAYSNTVKIKLLGVKKETIEINGAVSREVVEQMSQGVVSATGSDYGIATSGIAGPGGGTASKPVGTVWIAVAKHNKVISKEFHFGNTRSANIQRTVNAALAMLIDLI
jgi:nicotinamide-nucleotide amidase